MVAGIIFYIFKDGDVFEFILAPGGIFILVFLVFAIYAIFSKFINLKYTEYKFYQNKLEYIDNFWSKAKNTIFYNKITSVSRSSNIIERFFGIETIFVNTMSSGYMRGYMRIKYIKNAEEIYNYLLDIVSRNNT